MARLAASYRELWQIYLREHSRPAPFSHPLWSFVSDFRMFGLWASGRLGSDLACHGLN